MLTQVLSFYNKVQVGNGKKSWFTVKQFNNDTFIWTVNYGESQNHPHSTTKCVFKHSLGYINYIYIIYELKRYPETNMAICHSAL